MFKRENSPSELMVKKSMILQITFKSIKTKLERVILNYLI